MNKLSKIFCVIIIILTIALAIISYKFFSIRKKYTSLGEDLMKIVEEVQGTEED